MPASFVSSSKQYLYLPSTLTVGSGSGAVVNTVGASLSFVSGGVLTVAAFVKLSDIKADYCILAKNQDSYSNGSYLLRYNKDTNCFDWIVSDYTGSFVVSAAAPSTATSAGSGVFVCAQWIAGGCSISVNNSTFTNQSTVAAIKPEARQFTGTAHDSVSKENFTFTIGYDPGNPNASYCNGQIGSVGVWNRLLPTSGITALYNSQAPVLFANVPADLITGCAAYWDLDSDTSDDTQFGNNLTAVGSPTESSSWA